MLTRGTLIRLREFLFAGFRLFYSYLQISSLHWVRPFHDSIWFPWFSFFFHLYNFLSRLHQSGLLIGCYLQSLHRLPAALLSNWSPHFLFSVLFSFSFIIASVRPPIRCKSSNNTLWWLALTPCFLWFCCFQIFLLFFSFFFSFFAG